MKKIIFSASLSVVLTVGLCQPVFALPGWNAAKIRNWIKYHKFLAPDFSESIGGVVSWHLSGNREVEGLGKLIVNYQREAKLPQEMSYPGNAVFNWVSIFVLGKENNKPLHWSRDSKNTQILLEQIYGDALSQDFKSAKFVFKCHDYVSDGSEGPVHRGKIFSVPEYEDAIGDHGEVQIFQGKIFAYEVASDSVFGHILSIYPLKDIPVQMAILQHNKRIYEAYSRQEARKKPAKLNLDSAEN